MATITRASGIRSLDGHHSSTPRIDWQRFSSGNYRTSCPACGRGERDKTVGLTIKLDGFGVAHCFRCNYVETYCAENLGQYRPGHGINANAKVKPYETLSDFGQYLWAQSQPLHGISLDYLKARQCVIPPEDGDLRFHPNLKHPSGYVGPALVALITDAVTGKPMSLHRTWIRPDGRKVDVAAPRLLLRGHRKQGGVIRLWPDECVTHRLAIAEGIETCLSLAWAYTPVWSLIDAGNIATFPVLSAIQTLMIGADNDPVGRTAAQECATRWVEANVEVYVTQQEHNDLNDVLMEPA